MNPAMQDGAAPGGDGAVPAASSLRIVHVIVSLKVGGAEIALLRLAEAARRDGQRHTVISMMPDGAMIERFVQAGIELIVLDMRHSPVSSFVRLVTLLRSLRPDVVQTWLFAADFLGGLAARLAGCRRLLWSIHSVTVDEVSSRPTRLFRVLNARLSHWLPTRIASVADAGVRSHVALGYDASRFVVIPNGFDLQHLQPNLPERERQRASLGIGADVLVVGWVGRYNAAKDCENFLRAAGLLARQHPGLRFLMVGREIDAGNVELMRAAQAAGLGGNLILAGEQGDVRSFFAAMDIFCMSSFTEAFPLVLGEAMCMALPCVGTDVGDSAVLMGDTGKLVPARSPQALADALQDLVRMTPGERAAQGAAARARVAAEFSLAANCRRYETLYRQIIDATPTR